MRIRDIVLPCCNVKATIGTSPYIEIGDIDTETKTYSLKNKESVAGAVMAQPGCILVSTVRPTRGAIAILKDEAAVSNAFVILRTKESLYRLKFLFYVINNPAFFMYLGSNSKGATYPTCSKDTVLDYSIPDFSLSEQDYIISQFDALSSIIHQKMNELRLLDVLIKARFVESFGDPVFNNMRWQTKPLEEACKTIVDCPHSTPNYTFEDTGYMCIRTSIVKKNHIMWDEIEYIPKYEFFQRIQRKKPEKGDVIYTREGAILGIAAVIDRDCNVALGQRSMLLSPDTKVCTAEFLSVAMNFDSFLNNALKGMSGSASPHINVGDIKSFQMILPPIEQQRAFSIFFQQIDKSKIVIQQSLDTTELLFDCLMQKYFE